MKPLYLILIFFTLLFPIALSFDKRVHFVRNWKWVFMASLIVAIPFLLWDQFFTQNEIWGFNDDYLVGIYLGNLPIEEVLFFFVVPFACTFIYECVKHYAKNLKLKWFNIVFASVLITYALIVEIEGFGRWYTDLVVSISIVVIALTYSRIEENRFIPLAFCFSFIPFLLVNGVLTGWLLPEPIVWYNHAEFSQMRIGTIPMEDTLYGFSLITSNILVFELLRITIGKRKSTIKT